MILSVKRREGDIIIEGVHSFNIDIEKCDVHSFNVGKGKKTIWYKKSSSALAANLPIWEVVSYACYSDNGILIKEKK